MLWHLQQITDGWQVISQDFECWIATMRSGNPDHTRALTDVLGYHPTCSSYGTQPWHEYLKRQHWEEVMGQPLTEEEHEIVDRELAKIYGSGDQ